MSEEITQKPSWWQRIGWLILIWSLSVLSLGAIALVLRLFMHAAGMRSE
jgi:hypothetical protein